jgi:hypothetical protein
VALSEPEPDTWQVTPADAVGRYFVASQSQAGKYMVDLLAYNGHGQCACPQWVYRIGPAREKGEQPPVRWCKHIAAAREVMLDDVIARMLAQAGQG